MRVVSRLATRTFAERFLDALEPLGCWVNAVEAASWKTSGGVRQSFHSADFVGDLTVFDVGGNTYRLIAYIQYQRGNVLIKNILTHKEFDEGAWKR